MSTELVLITPVLLLLLGFVVMTGRIGEVDGSVGHAAHQAARAASLVGSVDNAQATARATATSNLEALGVRCRDLTISVDTSRFGPGGDVAVEVSCTVDLATVAFTGLPGHRTVTADAVEVVDRYRGDG